ncbi:menaquinone biosynthesis protein [Edaphobacter sp. 4G125]|nr:menaquinone biosynthesis protein [Edaphobacter sp. 4G125]
MEADDRTQHSPVPFCIFYTRSLSASSHPVRVAAIKFLNPAPLMWDFEHPPLASTLAESYKLHYTLPSRCADELLAGRADLGLIPIASLTPDLAIVPGCTIASLKRVRSIQLIVKQPHTLETVRTVAADDASRSSRTYAEILFRNFLGTSPTFLTEHADPLAMLHHADAALLIGDPALLALESRQQIEETVGPCQWFDLAYEWRLRTGLPWVAAVWAVRPEALHKNHLTATQLTEQLIDSRDHGLTHIDDLVREWTPRIAIPPATIRNYLTVNIHYTLTEDCIQTIELFRRYAAKSGVLPPLPSLHFL